MNTHRTQVAGFTMIEMVVTLSILGILIAIAVPSMSGWLANNRVRTTAQSLLNGMQLAKAEAIRNNQRVRFSLDGTGGAGTVRRSIGGCNFDTAVATSLVQADTTTSHNAGSIISALADDGNAASTFIFGANGFQTCDIAAQFRTLTVSNTAAENTRRIATSVSGRLLLCDPDLNSKLSSGDPRKCP